MGAQLDAVCVALTALWTSALTGVQVVDGPQATSLDADQWLVVGFDAENSETSEGGAAEQEWLAFNLVKQEQGEVVSTIVVRSGAVDIPAVRTQAFAVLASAEAALRADNKLGGLLMQSYVSSYRYVPTVTSAGCRVRVVFTVTYQAQI